MVVVPGHDGNDPPIARLTNSLRTIARPRPGWSAALLVGSTFIALTLLLSVIAPPHRLVHPSVVLSGVLLSTLCWMVLVPIPGVRSEVRRHWRSLLCFATLSGSLAFVFWVWTFMLLLIWPALALSTIGLLLLGVSRIRSASAQGLGMTCAAVFSAIVLTFGFDDVAAASVEVRLRLAQTHLENQIPGLIADHRPSHAFDTTLVGRVGGEPTVVGWIWFTGPSSGSSSGVAHDPHGLLEPYGEWSAGVDWGYFSQHNCDQLFDEWVVCSFT